MHLYHWVPRTWFTACHFLIWLSHDSKVGSPETIDTVVLASLPTELEDNELNHLVARHMLQRECAPSAPVGTTLGTNVASIFPNHSRMLLLLLIKKWDRNVLHQRNATPEWRHTTHTYWSAIDATFTWKSAMRIWQSNISSNMYTKVWYRCCWSNQNKRGGSFLDR